jgi:hypothetical protein
MKASRIWAVAAVLTVMSATVGAPVLGGSAKAAPGWTLQKVVNPMIPDGQLVAVSCVASTACVGVGTDESGATSLSETWNGTAWTLVPVPTPSGASTIALDGISCRSSTQCVAVGAAFGNNDSSELPGAEVWNGSAWSASTVPVPGGSTFASLVGVSCVSTTDCVAVGSYEDTSSNEDPFAETWNGAGWAVQTMPSPSATSNLYTSGVSCTSSTACIAVGGYQSSTAEVAFAERLTGGSWSVLTVPMPAGSDYAGLSGISCVSTGCVAVGSDENSGGTSLPLVENWNGAAWSIVSAPKPNGSTETELNSVSCTSSSACVAVGDYVHSKELPLAESLGSSGWKVTTVPAPTGGGSRFFDVSCVSAQSCIAVGEIYAPTTETLADAWNGSKWTFQSTPTPKVPDGYLSSIACTSASACTAVGSAQSLLAEVWNGKKWSIQKTPTPKSWLVPTFEAVACAAATMCMGVGDYNSQTIPKVARSNGPNGGTTAQLPFVDRLNGTKWTASALTVSTPRSGLNAIACPTTSACLAVGWYEDSSTDFVPLAEAWNGTKWTMSAPPNPSGSLDTELNGVACTSSTACLAVGSSQVGPLLESWNGASWTVVAVPSPSGATEGAGLSGIDCTSSQACVVTGSYEDSSFVEHLFGETWNGTTWTVTTVPVPSGSNYPQLYGLACTSASACLAIGSYRVNATGDEAELADSWNGSSWALTTVPAPPGSNNASLGGISCAGDGSCTVVGQSDVPAYAAFAEQEP